MKMRVIYVAFTSYSISLDRRFFPLADRDESGPGCHRGRCGPPVGNCQALKALEARRCLMTCVGTKILTQNINMTDFKTFLYWWWRHHFKCGSFCNHATWFKLTVMLTEKNPNKYVFLSMYSTPTPTMFSFSRYRYGTSKSRPVFPVIGRRVYYFIRFQLFILLCIGDHDFDPRWRRVGGGPPTTRNLNNLFWNAIL